MSDIHMQRHATMAGTRLPWPGPELAVLHDHSALAGDAGSLRAALAEDGYLRLRGLLPRPRVLAARRRIAAFLAEHGCLDGDPGTEPLRGRPGPTMGNPAITHDEAVLAVLEAPELAACFTTLIGEPVRTYDYKWLRAVAPGASTGAHCDVVYMGRGTLDLLTCWIPLGDTPVEHGTLTILEGSHRSPALARVRETYGRVDIDRDRIDGWFDQNPLAVSERYGGRWLSADFAAGDLIVFGMHCMHASTVNTGDGLRLSCDVRWQAAAAPIDERWVGRRPPGHVRGTTASTSMAEARARWGV